MQTVYIYSYIVEINMSVPMQHKSPADFQFSHMPILMKINSFHLQSSQRAGQKHDFYGERMVSVFHLYIDCFYLYDLMLDIKKCEAHGAMFKTDANVCRFNISTECIFIVMRTN